ncbi:MAG: hypothetical protein HFJ84_09770 [Clostridiales bacterium]|nr:hypothetical protein [Clostridiales bacterium]
MKRKRLGAIIIALMLALSTSVPAFAAGETQIGSQIEMTIPSETIMDVMEENSNIDPTCPWTADTQVQETIPTYDLDNNISGYILNLSTDGKDTGYLVYDISSDEPVLTEFGYEGVYSIQGEEVTQDSKLGKSKLIPVGMNEYVLQKGNDLYTIKTNTKVTDQKEEIQKVLEEKQDNLAEYVQSEQMASTLSTRAQEIYTSVSVPNLFAGSHTPITMQQHGDASCAAVCNVNMLKYWHECRNIPSLYNSYDEPKLSQTVSRMRPSINEFWYESGGSGGYAAYTQDAYSGISKYCKTYACTAPKGSDYKSGLNWTWYKTQINNGNFMFINARVGNYDGSGRDAHHAFSGVGYQETSTGNFMRVGDQWTTNYSHFFNISAYSGDVSDMFYCRW